MKNIEDDAISLSNSQVFSNNIQRKEISYQDAIGDFISSARHDGIEIREVVPNGRINRFRDILRGDHNPNGYYSLHLDTPIPWGVYGHWSDKGGSGRIERHWVHKEANNLPAHEYKKLMEVIKVAKKEMMTEITKDREIAEAEAELIWKKCIRIDGDGSSHAYLVKKQIKPCGAKLFSDDDSKLVIPIYNQKRKLISLQFISENGDKRFFKGTSPKDGFCIINEFSTGTVCICEGFATGVSIYMATGYKVIVAFSAENMLSCTKIARNMFKSSDIVVCADNDAYRDINTGLEKATDAARDTGSVVIYPTFKDVSTSPTDFNDLYVLEGADVVKKYFINICRLPHAYLHDFMERQFTKAECLMSPWLESGTLNMFYAKPGIGKSLLALHVAYSIASGGNIEALKWEAKESNVVLYLDGELRGESIQKDLRCIANDDITYSIGKNLIVSTLEDVSNDNVDIGTPVWQKTIDDIIRMRRPKLVIIDNILTFVRSGKSNDLDFWNRITGWTKSHTKRGVSFLFIHHENKHGNTSYGTSAIENSMSSIIALSRQNNDLSDGESEEKDAAEEISTTFILEYKKNRYANSERLRPTLVTISTSFKEQKTTIFAEGYEKTLKQKIIDLFNSRAITYKEIQAELMQASKCSPPSSPYISKVLHKAEKDGLITRDLMPWEKIKF